MINGQIDIDGGAAAGMMDTCGARAGEAAAEEIQESMGVGRAGRRQTGAENSERIRARMCVSVSDAHTRVYVYIYCTCFGFPFYMFVYECICWRAAHSSLLTMGVRPQKGPRPLPGPFSGDVK